MEAILDRNFSNVEDRKQFNRLFSRMFRVSPGPACQLLLRAVDILLLNGTNDLIVELEVLQRVSPNHADQLACTLKGLSDKEWEACDHKKCLEVLVNYPHIPQNLVKVVLRQASHSVRSVLRILSDSISKPPALIEAYTALSLKYPSYNSIASNAAIMLAQKYNDPRMWSLGLSLETRIDALVDKCRRLWLADGDIETLVMTVRFDRLLEATTLPKLAGTLSSRPLRIASLARAVTRKPFGVRFLLTLLAMVPSPKWMSLLDHLLPHLNEQTVEEQRCWQILWHAATGKCMSLENVHELLASVEDSELLGILALCSPSEEVAWDACQKISDTDIRKLQGVHGCPHHDDVAKWQEQLRSKAQESSSTYSKLIIEQEAAELAVAQNQLLAALGILGTLLVNLSAIEKYHGLMMDVLHRSSQLLLFFGSIDDAWFCIRKAMGRARSLELAARQAILRRDYNVIAELVGAERDEGPFLPSPWSTLPCLENLPAIRSRHVCAMQNLQRNPLYMLLNEAALTIFGTNSKPGRRLRGARYPEEIYQDLKNLGRNGAWNEKFERAQLLGISSAILNTLASPVDESCFDEREETRFAGLAASRTFHHGAEYIQNRRFPDHVVAVAIDIDIDESCVVLTRIEPFHPPLSVRLPTARVRSLLSIDHSTEPELKISDGLKELHRIIEGSVSDAYRLQNLNAEFWQNQRNWDDEARRLVFRMQTHWLGGFRAIFEPTTLAHGPEICNQLNQALKEHLPSKIQLNLSPPILALFTRLGHATEAEIEDLLWYILDTLQFQGEPVGYDDVDMDALVIKIHAILRYSPEVTRTHHLVLITDSLASQVPWECFPFMRDIPASRQLNLDLLYRGPYSQNLGPEIRYILNPGDNLQHLGENFSAAEFRLRGWSGKANAPPSANELLSTLQEATCLIYMGHGAGTSYIQRSNLRSMKKCCPVLLFGCASVRLREHAQYDASGPLTDYLIAGSPLVMGNLWTVKDKDMNRLAKEFITRVFDYGEDPCKALMNCRRACLLHYLTGAAPVIYGYPSTPSAATM